MADLGIIFSQEKTHHPLIPVIIYNYYRKYAVPFFWATLYNVIFCGALYLHLFYENM